MLYRAMLQGAFAARAGRLLRCQAVPDVRGEAPAGRTDRADADADRQLVQEPAAARPLVAAPAARPTTLRRATHRPTDNAVSLLALPA